MDKTDGSIRLYRCILDSRVFAHQTALKIWIWCLCKASYKKRDVPLKIGAGTTIVKLSPGQFIFGRHKAEQELKIDESTVYHWIKKFASKQFDEMIDIKANNQYSIITICKWDEYQLGNFKSEQSSEQPQNSHRTAIEQPQNTYNNVNNVNKVNKVNKKKKGEKRISPHLVEKIEKTNILEIPEIPENATKTLPDASSTSNAGEIQKHKDRKPVILEPPSLKDVEKYFIEHGFPITLAKRAWEGYQENNWIDSQGNEIKNWKQKMVQVWFKDEHKIKTGIVEHGQHPGQNFVSGQVPASYKK